MIGLSVVPVGLTVTAALESRARRLDRRIGRLDHGLDLLMRHHGVPDDDPDLAEVAALLRAGQHTPPIRKYREATGGPACWRPSRRPTASSGDGTRRRGIRTELRT